jgi:hypothetical protein
MSQIPALQKRQLPSSLEPASFVRLCSLSYYLHVFFKLLLHGLPSAELLLNDLILIKFFSIFPNTQIDNKIFLQPPTTEKRLNFDRIEQLALLSLLCLLVIFF